MKELEVATNDEEQNMREASLDWKSHIDYKTGMHLSQDEVGIDEDDEEWAGDVWVRKLEMGDS